MARGGGILSVVMEFGSITQANGSILKVGWIFWK